MDKENKTNNNENKIRVTTTIFISIFFSIFNVYPFVLTAENSGLMISISIILSIIYYVIISKLYAIYNKTLLFFIMKVNKVRTKEPNFRTYSVWLFPSLIAVMGSFVSFLISNYYIYLFTRTLEWSEIDYTSLVKNINMIYPWIVLVFIFLGIIIQTYFIRKEEVKIFPAFLSSFFTIAVFTIIFFMIRNIISNILTWL